MAKLYITEFKGLGTDGFGNAVSTGILPPVTTQTVDIGGTSTQSAAFNASTKVIRVHTDVICSFEVATNPTATANSARMAAGQTEYLSVIPGDKIAVITNT